MCGEVFFRYPTIRLYGAVVVDVRGEEVAGEQVADDAQRQLGLLVDERRRGGRLGARLDRLPEALQEDEVALDVLGRGALGGRAHDDPALLHVELLEDLLQPRPLGVVETARDAEPFAVRDVDEEPAGQRDLRRQPGALRLHRVLDRLHEHLLAARDQIGDLLPLALPLELGHDDLVDVEEAVLLQPDLDERGLHAGQHVVDDTEVDVPGDRAALGPLEVDLGDLPVLEHRHALLADVDRDQQLALRRGQRCPARRLLAPPVARPRPPRAAVGLVLGLGGRLGAGRRRLAPRRSSHCRGLGVAIRRRRLRRASSSCDLARRGYRGGACGAAPRSP